MWTTIAPVLVTGAVAILVPWLTFRYALDQERRRWIREQRAAVYVDLLVEASADIDWLEHTLSDREVGESRPFEDHRMDNLERRRLGARVFAFGSTEVIRLHNKLTAVGFWTLSAQGLGPTERMRISDASEALNQQIRKELTAEHPRPAIRPGSKSV